VRLRSVSAAAYPPGSASLPCWAERAVATARKIAERVYRLLKYGECYVRQAMDAYENAYRIKLTKGLAKKAAELSYKLVPNAEVASTV
jgi:hypothetical protein